MAAGPGWGNLGLGNLGLGNLIGRDDELSAIGEMLSDAGGRGLLLVGEPGIGKSALLRAASVMAARDDQAVLRAAGVPAETGMPYAGLHQLLYPLAGSFASLAPRPREALRAAFGHADRPATEMFPVAVATLELLAAIRHGFEDVLVEADLPVLMLRPLDVDGEGGLMALPRPPRGPGARTKRGRSWPRSGRLNATA